MTDFEWTDQRVARLKELWLAGHSYTQITSAMGAPSRNSIGGKIMRLRDAGEIGEGRVVLTRKNMAPSAKRNRCSPGLAHVPLIKARLDEGKNDREIADECGIRPDDVRYVRRIKGLQCAKRPPAPVPPFAEELKRLALEGLSDNEVARALGITYHQARYERRRQHLPSTAAKRTPVTTITKGDPGAKVAAVFAEGFMGQRSRVGLLELASSGMCRFPIDQPDGPVRYCGDETGPDQVYCSHHAARCYTSSEPKSPLKPSHVYAARR